MFLLVVLVMIGTDDYGGWVVHKVETLWCWLLFLLSPLLLTHKLSQVSVSLSVKPFHDARFFYALIFRWFFFIWRHNFLFNWRHFILVEATSVFLWEKQGFWLTEKKVFDCHSRFIFVSLCSGTPRLFPIWTSIFFHI